MVALVHTAGEPVISESPAQHILFRHFVVEQDDLAGTIQRTFPALYGRVAEAGVIPVGPPFIIYYDDSIPGVHWVMDVCVPVSSPITPHPDFEYMELPATRVVSLLHIGPYESLGTAYETIDRFIADKGLTIGGAVREFYMSPPDVPGSEVQTRVERPIT